MDRKKKKGGTMREKGSHPMMSAKATANDGGISFWVVDGRRWST